VKKGNPISFLEDLISQAFPLCYVILPDDLQAHQVTIDAFTSFSLQETEAIKSLYKAESKADENEVKNIKEQIRQLYFSRIYHLALRRFYQIKGSLILNSNVNFFKFYNLDVKTRVVVFFKHKMKFSFDQIEKIMNLSRTDIINKLNLGRDEILGPEILLHQRHSIDA